MIAKDQIVKSLQKLTGLSDINPDIPEREEFGDYSSNMAMVIFSEHKKDKHSESAVTKKEATSQNVSLDISGKTYSSPRELAEVIIKELNKDENLLEIVERMDIAGPGFINFHLKTDVLLNNLIQIVSNQDFGRNGIDKSKNVLIEFAHPNTHKPFHIGHLRNITTGESLARILSYAGHYVTRGNYQGDVGLHIAKAIWGIHKLGFSDFDGVRERAGYLGKAYVEGNKAYEENETAKEEIHKINEALYEKENTELLELYQKTRQWSLDYFSLIYDRVGTKFDRLYFESEVADEGTRLAYEAVEKGILEKSESAIIFPGSKHGLHDRVFITSRGVPTYEGKDLGLAKLQFSEYDPDLLIHVVGPEQTEYFKVLFKALEAVLPETQGREVHVPYGWVRLKEGKMSSRTGNVVLGEWLLDEAKKRIIEKYKSDESTAEAIAVGAVKYSFLKNGLSQEIAFDLDESIALEGNSGPYLQYTYARIQSVLLKAQNMSTVDSLSSVSLESEELSLLRHFSHFNDIISMSVKLYSPNLICNYLYSLAQKFNTFYNKHKILTDNPHKLELRLRLVRATGTILKTGLYLLGIEAPSRM